jgi:hypothetical protein
MKIKKGITSQLASCYDCDKNWEGHEKSRAMNNARSHAKNTGHMVKVETGISTTYNPRK